MRTEQLLAGLAAVVAGLAALSGGSVVQDLVVDAPLHSSLSLAGELSSAPVEQPGSFESPDAEAGQSFPTRRTGDPARAFSSPASAAHRRASAQAPSSAIPSGGLEAVPSTGEPAGTESWVVEVPVALELPKNESTGRPPTPHQAALAWLNSQHGLFGAGLPGRMLRPLGSPRFSANRVAVDFRQTIGELPVVGARVTVTMNRNLAVLSAGGRSSAAGPASDAASVPAADAEAAAVAALAQSAGRDPAGLSATEAQLWFVDPVLTPAVAGSARAMWRVAVSPDDGSAAAVDLLVDAQTGAVVQLSGESALEPPVGQPTSGPSVVPAPSPTTGLSDVQPN